MRNYWDLSAILFRKFYMENQRFGPRVLWIIHWKIRSEKLTRRYKCSDLGPKPKNWCKQTLLPLFYFQTLIEIEVQILFAL